MDNESKFLKVNLSFGQWIYNVILLQFLPIIYTLKGAIVLGIFPSIASTFNVFYKWISTGEYDFSVHTEFRTYYDKYFWQSNKLGWIMFSVGTVLALDLYISSQFIQSIIFHTVLIILSFIYIVICSYSFIVFARYDYPRITIYIKQCFYIGLSSIVQSVAILLAVLVVSYVFSYIPFILLFFGIPLMIGSISWFAVQGILNAEKMRRNVHFD